MRCRQSELKDTAHHGLGVSYDIHDTAGKSLWYLRIQEARGDIHRQVGVKGEGVVAQEAWERLLSAEHHNTL